MNLSQLYHFKTLAKYNQFSKAAKSLYVTQPALSNSISRLEKELGATLFVRDQGGVFLTEDGMKFDRHISTALSEIDKAVSVLHDGGVDSSAIRIATTDSIQRNYLPSFLSAFRQDYKNPILYDITTSNTYEAIKGLREGRYDVAFCTALPLDDLDSIPFLTQRLVVYVNVQHPLAKQEEISMSVLREYADSVISYHSKSIMSRLLRNVLGSLGLRFEERFMTEIDLSSLVSVDQSAIGIALDTVEDMSFPMVTTIPIVEFRGSFHLVSLVFKKGILLNQYISDFLEFARNHSLVIPSDSPQDVAFWKERDRKECGL